MKATIDTLVSMRDIAGLEDVMNDSEDWLDSLDAAEGLVKLGERSGLEYLLAASQSDDDEITAIVREILASPEVKHIRQQLEAEEKQVHQARLETARLRLQKGKRVYLHKVIYVTADEILQDDSSGKGFIVPGLEDAGLEGWELVNILPRRRQMLVGSVDDHFVGAYLFLKKELTPDESMDLQA